MVWGGGDLVQSSGLLKNTTQTYEQWGIGGMIGWLPEPCTQAFEVRVKLLNSVFLSATC